ncbi:hypothetical protein PHBOTO_006102, partial [Pseudozyma hubeiensis]
TNRPLRAHTPSPRAHTSLPKQERAVSSFKPALTSNEGPMLVRKTAQSEEGAGALPIANPVMWGIVAPT